jgi:hypothetical protein
MNRLICGFLTVCVLAFISSPTDAQQKNNKVTNQNYKTERYRIGEELFFSVEVGNFALGDIYALNTEDGIFIDLDSYIVATDFQIEIVDFLHYQGWYAKEENTFSLQRNEENIFVVKTNTIDRQLSDEEIQIFTDIVYVSPKLIYELFKIGHEFDETSLTLTLYPEQKLPIQLKLERENKRLRSSGRKGHAQYPQLWRGYEFLSPQSLDLSLNSVYSEQRDRLSARYSVIGGREIAYHNMRFFLNGTNKQTLSNARLLFSKNLDISSGFKNPIVKAYEFGDVDSVSVGGSAFRSNSVGLVLTNDPTVRQLNDARTTTISGEVQEGWDIELYRNQILIDRLSEVNSGRYIFPDIPLYLGENKFEIVLYGPQGQVIRLSQNEYVNAYAAQSSSIRYKSSLTKLDSKLLPVSNRSGLLQSDLYDWSTQLSKGISAKSSVSAGLSLQAGTEGVNRINLGMNSAFSDRVLVGVSYSVDDDKNQALGASMRSSLFGHDFNVTYFGSKNAASDSINHRLNFNNRGVFALPDKRMSYQNKISMARSLDKTKIEIVNSLGVKIGRGNFNNSLKYIITEDNNMEIQKQFLGNVNYRVGLGPVSTRLGINYEESDNSLTIDSYSLDLSWSPFEKLKSRFRVDYSKLADVWSTGLDIGYETNNVIYSSYLTKSSFSGVSVGLTARVSVGGEPFNQGVFASNLNLSPQGTVVVRTFIDANANAVYDHGDSLISGVDVVSIQSYAKGTTNENGITTLKGLSTSRKTDIEIQLDSIDEPFLIPIVKGISVLPRESFIDHIDYPLVFVSDIDGTVDIKDYSFDKVRRPLRVRLLNNRKEVVATTLAEFDGYFFFSEIPPGDYVIDVDNSSLTSNKLKLVETASVQVSVISELLTSNDIKISPIQFNEGYRVELAKLSSLPLLKAYWERVRSIDINLFSSSPVFYVQHPGKYSLNIGFYESVDAAQQYCTMLGEYQLNCSIEAYSSPKF